MPTRRLESWVDAFCQYTSKFPSPLIWRKWAAIATIAGALERKVWIKTFENLYPNLYTVLDGPPGKGKTVLVNTVMNLWHELTEHHLAPSSVSRASLMDALREADRKVVRPQDNPPVISFNSLLIAQNELGVLIPAYDNDFMNTLTDIYDGKRYGERKRGAELNYVMEHPQLNLLAGTTPSYMNELMPEGAWDQGFISRVLLIYSGESTLQPIFQDDATDDGPFEVLVHDLKIISKLYGRMLFTKEAAEAITNWHMAKGPPTPDHPKLQHYNTRRTAHVLKLCMIASASVSDKLEVTVEHYQEALNWLLEAEVYMPDVFKSMATGGDARAIEDTWHYAYTIYVKEKAPIMEHRLVGFLQQRVPAHSVMRVLDVMVRANLLESKLEKTGRAYVPKGRTQV